MPRVNVLANDKFLRSVGKVREEIKYRFVRTYHVLKGRELELLSQLDQLEERYKGDETTEQIEELNKLIEVQLETSKLNTNKDLVMQHVDELRTKVKDLSEDLEKERAGKRSVALEWDGELEARLGELGGIQVSQVPDYTEKGKPVLTTCKHKDEYSQSLGVFCYPRSIAIDSETGNVFICDGGNNRVQVFNKCYKFLFDFNEKMYTPEGICVSKDSVHVTQFSGHCLNKYTAEGNLLQSVGRSGNKELEFDYPWGVAASTDRVYVCDSNNNRIQCLNSDLTFNSFVSDIPYPRDIKLTPEHIVVLTGGDHYIRYYDYLNELVSEIIPRRGDLNPWYFCLDIEHNILMTDLSADCVVIFTRRGESVHKFGERGRGRGRFVDPKGIALDSDYRIVVISINREHCVQLF